MTERLPLAHINIEDSPQIRAMNSYGTIGEYAEAYREGATFPPVVVFFDGTDHWLADGFHRTRAAQMAGLEDIDADVRPGTRRDAILYAAGANATHGLRRANADKRRAVELLLSDPEWSQWSDREIARRAQVHHQLVARLRAERHLDDHPDGRIVRRGGTSYTMTVGGIGARQQPERPFWQQLDELLTGVRPIRTFGELLATLSPITPVDRPAGEVALETPPEVLPRHVAFFNCFLPHLREAVVELEARWPHSTQAQGQVRAAGLE